MKKILIYTTLAALLFLGSGCAQIGEQPLPAERTAESAVEAEAVAVHHTEASRRFGAAAQAAAAVVAEAAQDYVPPLRAADGSLLLTYEDLVARMNDPEQAAAMQQWFANTLFIGDSRTVGMGQYSQLAHADFFALTGMSVFDVFKSEVEMVKDSGEKHTLEALLTTRQYDRIYLMLGINELGYSISRIEGKYAEVVDRIRALQPEAQLWLQANMHVTQGRSEKDPTFNNTTINALNTVICDIARQRELGWLDVNPVFDDAGGNLSMDFTFDHTHILGKYYKYWAMWIYLQSSAQ